MHLISSSTYCSILNAIQLCTAYPLFSVCSVCKVSIGIQNLIHSSWVLSYQCMKKKSLFMVKDKKVCSPLCCLSWKQPRHLQERPFLLKIISFMFCSGRMF